MSIGSTSPRAFGPTTTNTTTTTSTTTTSTTTTSTTAATTTGVTATTGVTVTPAHSRPRARGVTVHSRVPDGNASTVSSEPAKERRSQKEATARGHVRVQSAETSASSSLPAKADRNQRPHTENARHTLPADVEEMDLTIRQGVMSADDAVTQVFRAVIAQDWKAVRKATTALSHALMSLNNRSSFGPQAAWSAFAPRLKQRLEDMREDVLRNLGRALHDLPPGHKLMDDIHQAVNAEIDGRDREERLKPWELSSEPGTASSARYAVERNLLDAFAALRLQSKGLADQACKTFLFNLKQKASPSSAFPPPRNEDYTERLRLRLGEMPVEVMREYQGLVASFPDKRNPLIQQLGGALDLAIAERPQRLEALANADAEMASLVASLMSMKVIDASGHAQRFVEILLPFVGTGLGDVNAIPANDAERGTLELYGSRLDLGIVAKLSKQAQTDLREGARAYLERFADQLVEAIFAAADQRLRVHAQMLAHRARTAGKADSST